MKRNVPTLKDIVEFLRIEYLRWKYVYGNGCADPSWEDGVNLNLVRNHILYYKGVIEEMCGTDYFNTPDEYYWPTPPTLPDSYMAKTRRLACRGGLLNATERNYEVTW